MYAQLSAQYRKIGNHLYRREGAAFIRVATVPRHIKTLPQAVRWFRSCE